MNSIMMNGFINEATKLSAKKKSSKYGLLKGGLAGAMAGMSGAAMGEMSSRSSGLKKTPIGKALLIGGLLGAPLGIAAHYAMGKKGK